MISLVVICGLLPVAAWSQLPPPYCTQWGSQGIDPGQFESPWGVALNASGNVYVADQGNDRIQVFTSSGGYITQWGSDRPQNVALDASGTVYVAEPYNNCYQVFTSSGDYITQWGSYGTGPGQFYYPVGIALDASGNVYVVDEGNHRIQKFGYGPSAVQNTTWGRVKAMFR
jgi:DNA-binding beta-propeller fold protein YncE